jgi:hypothetical protein
MSDSVAALPERAREAASESISGAYGVAAKAGPAGAGLIRSANDAFVGSMHWAAGGSVLVALIGIAVVLAWLPRRSAPHAPAAPAAARSDEADLVATG